MAQWTREELCGVKMPPALETMVNSGKLVHALCIEGEPGDRRVQALAAALAGVALCGEQHGRMCGECLDCRKILEGVHSDFICSDGSGDDYKVKQLRQLRADAYRGPSEGRAKVFLLAQAQTMGKEAQNLLLKVIEEPPGETFFILACDNRYKLLPTILSRVVSVSLPPLSPKECLNGLQAAVPGRSEEDYRQAALFCCGSLGRGVEILTDPTEEKRTAAACSILEAMAAGNGYRLLAELASFEKNRQEYDALLQILSRLLGSTEVGREKQISFKKAIRLRDGVDRAIARNESNGYPALISAALAEDIRRLG